MTDRRLPWLVLGLCLAAAAAFIWELQAELGFAYDEWDFLLGRRDWSADAFLDPHHEHIALSLVAVYKGLAEGFGIESPLPWHAVSTLILLTAVIVVFVFMRRRVPWLVALAAILPIVVLGPATEHVIWPFQLAFSASIGAGVGALLLLERPGREGDLWACVLLVVSMSFSSLGIPFAIAVGVRVALSPDRIARAWVALVPVGLFGLWWLGWGREAESYFSFANVANAPAFVLDGLASSIASLVGMGRGGPANATALDIGRPLLLVGAAAAAWRIHRLGRVPDGLWVVGALAVSFWLLTALNANLFRLPTTGRYQLIGAVFVLMIAAELLRGVRFSRTAIGTIVVLAAVAAVSNAALLRDNWLAFRGQTEDQRGALSAVEIARDRIDRDFVIELTNRTSIYGDAGLYLDAVDDLGSPAWTPAELIAAPETARRTADEILVEALGVRLEPAGARTANEAGCIEVVPDDLGNAVVDLLPGGAVVRGGSAGVEVAVRRYSADFPVELGAVEPGTTAVVAIPTDGSTQAWQLGLSGSGSAAVCALEP